MCIFEHDDYPHQWYRLRAVNLSSQTVPISFSNSFWLLKFEKKLEVSFIKLCVCILRPLITSQFGAPILVGHALQDAYPHQWDHHHLEHLVWAEILYLYDPQLSNQKRTF